MKTLMTLIALLTTSTTLWAADVKCGDADWTEMIAWAEKFYVKNGTTLGGNTAQGMPCELNIWPYDNSTYYISLGTSTNGGVGPGDFTYIGTFINPDPITHGMCTIKQLEVTPLTAHIHVVQEEAGVPGTVEHDLFIRSDIEGNVTQAQGSSSYWPSSTCMFN